MASCTEICHRTPVGSLVGGIIILIGCFSCILNVWMVIISSQSYSKHLGAPNSDGAVGYLCLILVLLTMVLAILLILVAFAGSSDSNAKWVTALKGKTVCLVMLIITFLFLVFWMGYFYSTVLSLVLAQVSIQACSDYNYYKSRDHDGPLCIDIPMEADRKYRRICESKTIDFFCKDFNTVFTGSALFGVLGVETTLWGMFICLVCMGLNLSLSRLESSVDLDSIGKLPWKRLVRSMPIGTMYGTNISITGVFITIMTMVEMRNLTSVIDPHMTTRSQGSLAWKRQCKLVLLVITVLLILSVFISTFVGAFDRSQSKWTAIIKGKVVIIILLIISFFMTIIWRTIQSLDYFDIGQFLAVKKSCEDYFYFRGINDSSRCVYVSYVDNVNDRQLCDPELINEFCQHFIRHMTLYLYLSGFGINFIGVGMAVYSVSLGVNYTLVRLEPYINTDANTGRRRY